MKFFWGMKENEVKISWVKWDYVLKEKEEGGLGVGASEDLNKALLVKWLWRLKNEQEAIWARIIKSIHWHRSEDLERSDIKTGHTWKKIMKVWKEVGAWDL